MEIVKKLLRHYDIKTTEVGYNNISPRAIAPVGIKREIFTFSGLNADKIQPHHPAFIKVATEALTW